MEKIKIGASEYALIVNGISENDGLKVSINAEGYTVDGVEKVLTPENCQRIELLSDAGELMAVYNDYVKLEKIEKVIGYEIPGETAEAEPQKIDVIMFTLRKCGLQEQLDSMKSDLAEAKSNIDFLSMMQGV